MGQKVAFILIFILLLIILPFISGTISGSVYNVGSATSSVQGGNASGSIYSARTYLTFNTGGSANGSIYQGVVGFFGIFNSSAPSFYYVTTNQTSSVQAGNIYSVTIDITNSSSDTSISSTPVVTLYDSLNNLVISNAAMTLISDKKYQYNFTTSLTDIAGIWTTNISIGIDHISNRYGSNWNLSNGQTAVSINSIETDSGPIIKADITIIDEGGTDFEYSYEYCIVSDINQKCGDTNNVAYGSGSKFLKAGES